MDDGKSNPLKITGVTVTWEVEKIWNLSFDGASSASFMLSDHIFHLFARRYELSIAFYLCRDDSVPTNLPLLCSLSMVDQIGQEMSIGEKEVVIEKAKEVVLLVSVNIKDLEGQKEDYLVNDSLVVKCNLSASYRRRLLKEAEHEEKLINCFEKLSSDFESFYNLQEKTDTLLKIEDKEFSVHRTIICARCPAMASMLDAEARENILNIKDINSYIFRDILFYIYTGKLRSLTSDTVVPMLSAANKLDLQEVQNRCLQFLKSSLTDDNVFEVATLAHEDNNLPLREVVEKYLMDNLTNILPSDRWKDFCGKRSKLANEILTTVLLRIKEKEGES